MEKFDVYNVTNEELIKRLEAVAKAVEELDEVWLPNKMIYLGLDKWPIDYQFAEFAIDIREGVDDLKERINKYSK